MEFTLLMATPSLIEDALFLLKTHGLAEQFVKKITPLGILSHGSLGPGIWTDLSYVINTDPARMRTEIEFGMTPTIRAHFRIDEFVYEKAGHHTGVTSALRACSLMMNAMAGDAVFINHDSVWLLHRRNNHVQLNTDAGFWNPFRISHVDLPHRFQQPISIA